MKTVWIALGGLGFVSGAAFLVFWLLAWAGQVPLGEPLAISAGVMLLVTGVFCLRAAADKTADRGKWKRSNVKLGRLSAFAFGVGFGTIGTVFLGHGWLPERYGVWAAVAWLASFVLGVLGQWIDRRANEPPYFSTEARESPLSPGTPGERGRG
jgi:hypothetical protein